MAPFIEQSPLPSLNRYITTHDDSGKAILSTEIPSEAKWTSAGKEANFFLGYAIPNFPADLPSDMNTYNSILSSPPGLVIHGGLVLRIVYMAPGITSPMHRTTSLDY